MTRPAYLKVACITTMCILCVNAQTAGDVRVIVESTGRVTSSAGEDIVKIVDRGGSLYLDVTGPHGSWTTMLAGARVWSSLNDNGLHLRDVDGDGRAEIITETSNGASLGAFLRVYRYEPAVGFTLVSPVDAGGYGFAFATDNGKTKVVEFGKWTDKESAQVRALSWDGSKLVFDRPASERAYTEKREDLVRHVLSRTAQPAALRAADGRMAAALLMKAGKPDRAIAVSSELLTILNDSSLTIPVERQRSDVAGLTAAERADLTDSERLQALAAVHEILASIYTDIGNSAEADEHRRTATKLTSEATLKVKRVHRNM